jgi:hypothetical protein
MSDDNEADRDATDSLRDQPMSDDKEDGMEQLVNDSSAAAGDESAESAEQTAQDPSEATEEPASDGDETDEGMDDLRQKLNYALLAGLSLLALIAALQFYFNASSAINQWVTHEYRSLFQAVFNLVVLLLTAAGISRQVRRLTA